MTMPKLKQISLHKFKELMNTSYVDILKNQNTGKLFASIDSGDYFKVQGDLDTTKEVVFLIEDGDINNGCFINPGKGADLIVRL